MDIDITAYYEKYAPMVIRRCRRMLGNEEDALDAAQDVFVALLGAAEKLRGLYPSSFLYTVATNVCLNRIRQKKRRAETAQDAGELPLITIDRGYDRVEANMIMDTILLPESESTRTICFMYHADGMTLKEIGKAMGISVAGVWKRLRAFKSRAKIAYEGEKR
ncbi:sigma-70 family RNA polymerase sigma factor [Treponema primitia]|uniref:RNA polymerase sigma factor n=1 Tax=Treponema primitia TaxID=88058 RepID=UPI0039817F12